MSLWFNHNENVLRLNKSVFIIFSSVNVAQWKHYCIDFYEKIAFYAHTDFYKDDLALGHFSVYVVKFSVPKCHFKLLPLDSYLYIFFSTGWSISMHVAFTIGRRAYIWIFAALYFTYYTSHFTYLHHN